MRQKEKHGCRAHSILERKASRIQWQRQTAYEKPITETNKNNFKVYFIYVESKGALIKTAGGAKIHQGIKSLGSQEKATAYWNSSPILGEGNKTPRRYGKTIVRELGNTGFGSKSLDIRVVNSWNNLSEEVVQVRLVHELKEGLKNVVCVWGRQRVRFGADENGRLQHVLNCYFLNMMAMKVEVI